MSYEGRQAPVRMGMGKGYERHTIIAISMAPGPVTRGGGGGHEGDSRWRQCNS